MITIHHHHGMRARWIEYDTRSEWRKATYVLGILPPRYSVPATEVNAAIAMPFERVTPRVKRMVLRHYGII